MSPLESVIPEFPPTAKLNQFNLSRLLFSLIYMTFSITITKAFFFFIPQPKIPWPKNNKKENLCLSNTLTIVTGANSGVGYEIAKEQFRRGSNVILGCRNKERGERAIQNILKELNLYTLETKTTKRLRLITLDTVSLDSVRRFVDTIKQEFPNQKLDYLFLNAGIAQKPFNANRFTSDKLEYMYATNFLGQFLLTGLLSSLFSDSIRIISTSSNGAFQATFDPKIASQRRLGSGKEENHQMEVGFHTAKMNPIFNAILKPLKIDLFSQYEQTKAMQIAFGNILQSSFDLAAKENNHTRSKFAAAFHPGFVATNIFTGFFTPDQTFISSIAQRFIRLTALTPKEGAQAGLWLAHTFDARPGAFYDRNVELVLPWYKSFDDQLADRLWQRWNNDAGLKDSDWCF